MPQFDFKKQFDALQSFDWRSLKKYANPKVADDINAFLEKMPQNAGKTMLVIVGVAWATAGAVGLFTVMQLQEITKLRAELQSAEALKPIVPVITDIPVSGKDVESFVEKMKDVYEGIEIRANGASIVLTGTDTSSFAQFREAIGHVQNGGSGWRVSIDRLCVGRECDKQPLGASLKINKVSVEKPS